MQVFFALILLLHSFCFGYFSFFLCLGICFSVQILTYCHRLEAILDEKEAFPQSSKSESFVLFPLVHAVQFTMTYFSIVNFYATSSTEILPW